MEVSTVTVSLSVLIVTMYDSKRPDQIQTAFNRVSVLSDSRVDCRLNGD